MSIEQSFRAFAQAFPNRPPTRTSGNWSGLCGVCMVQFGAWFGGARTVGDFNNPWAYWQTRASGDVSSARRAANASGTLNTNAGAAPVGAFHFWDWNGIDNGHVGIDLVGKGTHIGMASNNVTTSLGSAIGFVSKSNYEQRSGARYLGWATNYAGGKLKGISSPSPQPSPPPPSKPEYREVLAPTDPGFRMYWPIGPVMEAIQKELKRLGHYSGPADGVGGENTAKGIQRAARAGGYVGPIDGSFGPNTAKGVQTLAKNKGGYAGPIDADPRENSWRGFLLALQRT